MGGDLIYTEGTSFLKIIHQENSKYQLFLSQWPVLILPQLLNHYFIVYIYTLSTNIYRIYLYMFNSPTRTLSSANGTLEVT